MFETACPCNLQYSSNDAKRYRIETNIGDAEKQNKQMRQISRAAAVAPRTTAK